MNAKNRRMIYDPKNDSTYVAGFKSPGGEALAISVPRGGNEGTKALRGANALWAIRAGCKLSRPLA
jgi:hypothetical protein